MKEFNPVGGNNETSVDECRCERERLRNHVQKRF